MKNKEMKDVRSKPEGEKKRQIKGSSLGQMLCRVPEVASQSGQMKFEMKDLR